MIASELERRVQTLETLMRVGAPLHETPTPGGVDTPRHKFKRAAATHSEIIPSAVVSSLDEAIWSVSPDGSQVHHMAGGVERTFGRSAIDFFSRPGFWFDIAAEHDRETLRDAFHHLAHTDAFQIEYAVKAAGGSLRWVHSRGRLIRSNDGTPLRVDGITSVRSRSEHAGLAILEAIGPRTGADLLNAAVEHLANGFDARAAIIASAHAAEPHAARTLAAWIDGRPAEPFSFAASGKFVKDVLAGGSQFIPTAARDRFPADEFLDRLRAESVAAAPLVAADGRLLGFIAVLDDRSFRSQPPDARAVLKALAPRIAVELQSPRTSAGEERIRELEERLAAAKQQSEESGRFETVGRLLAGAAHDFNNLLTLAAGHAELVRENLMSDPALRESLDVVVSSSHAAARVARQLIGYAKPASEPEEATLDPNAAVADSQVVLASLAGKRIELDLLLAPGVPPIRTSRTDFDRVVLNLVANAKDAIEDSGVIVVRTAATKVAADRRGWPQECPPGDYVALTVTDTGCGMTDDVKQRAFARFFTTKGAKGTGLGLPTVLDIVRAAGGHVELDSSTDWGTSVRVFWPAATEDDGPVSLSFENALTRIAE
jgi:signal transduction histidine kinase